MIGQRGARSRTMKSNVSISALCFSDGTDPYLDLPGQDVSILCAYVDPDMLSVLYDPRGQ